MWTGSDQPLNGSLIKPLRFVVGNDDLQISGYAPLMDIQEFWYTFKWPYNNASVRMNFTAYPALFDRFWVDDIQLLESPTKVEKYPGDYILRYDAIIPANTRSMMLYNDTLQVQTVNLGGTFVDLQGKNLTSVDIPIFGGIILIAEPWTHLRVKQ
jgi:hypothetical protein